MNVGVVGTGMIAQMVVPHFEKWGLPVAAVCGTPETEEQVCDLAGRVGAAPFTDYREMLSTGDIDTIYIAVPNHLHYRFALDALKAGKHVILEKPMTSNDAEAFALARTARDRCLFLFEAISTLYLPNYAKIRELLPRIGDVRVVSTNYSQYSSRYDAFQAGTVLPAFDPERSGGALMDLGLYNLHYIIGLFGEPKQVEYEANVDRGIDTSGVCTLDYDSFKAVSVAAKDCAAPSVNVIQGTQGYIVQTTPTNRCGALTLHLNDGTEETYDSSPELQWESEFRAFARAIEACDRSACDRALDHSLAVVRTMMRARRSAGVQFAADRMAPAVCACAGEEA